MRTRDDAEKQERSSPTVGMDDAELEKALAKVRLEWEARLAWLKAPDAEQRLDELWERLSRHDCVVIAGKDF